MAGALLRYRVMAWVTGVFLLCLSIWLILGYTVLGYSDGAVKPAAYSLMWTGHGWLYFIYLITAVDLTFRLRWSLWSTLGILVAGTIPLASFFAEHFVTKRVHADIAAGIIQPNRAAVTPPTASLDRSATAASSPTQSVPAAPPGQSVPAAPSPTESLPVSESAPSADTAS